MLITSDILPYTKIFNQDDGVIDYQLINMKLNSLVFNHEIIKLIEINDMGMLHPGEQP